MGTRNNKAPPIQHDRPILKHRQDEVRKQIQTTKLLQVVHDIASASEKVAKLAPAEKAVRLQAAQILLRKTLPDLSSVEMAGEGGGPLTVVVKKL